MIGSRWGQRGLGGLVVAVALSACGRSGAGAEVPAARDDYVAEAAQAMGLADEDAARCLAGSVVDAIGMPQIAAAELTPEDFARATSFEEMDVAVGHVEPTELERTLAACGGLVELFVRDASGGAAETCVRDVMSDELVAAAMVDELTGDDAGPELSAALDATYGCLGATATTG